MRCPEMRRGDQEGRFFHGDHDGYCFLPLHVFCGDHLLVAWGKMAYDEDNSSCSEFGPIWSAKEPDAVLNAPVVDSVFDNSSKAGIEHDFTGLTEADVTMEAAAS